MATTPALTNDQNNAYQQMVGILNQYGLGSLAPTILGYVKEGYDATAMTTLIQQTPAWEQRFAGNAMRLKNGLAPLDPATYLSTEASYQQALQSSGLPSSMYSTADFANWIGTNVSPTEIQDRVTTAMQFVDSADPAARQALDSYYGTQGNTASIAAYFLDEKKAEPILQQQAQAAEIGGAAIDQGLSTSQSQAEKFASQGVTTSQAQSAYSTIGKDLPALSSLGDIYHTAYGQTDLENQLLGGSGEEALKTQNLESQEEASFAGSGAVGNNLAQAGYGIATGTEGKF